MATNSIKYTIRSQQRVAGGGTYYRISHVSTSTNTSMTFGLFVPSRYANIVISCPSGDNDDDGGGGGGAAARSTDKKSSSKKKSTSIPALYFLSGLTCDGK